jgi:hypothetical protein
VSLECGFASMASDCISGGGAVVADTVCQANARCQ